MLKGIAHHARAGTLATRLRRGSDPANWYSLDDVPRREGFVRSARRLNRLAAGMTSCTSYLEVGVQYGYALRDVDVPFRWGVDPVRRFRLECLPQGVRLSVDTSDAFFATLARQQRFDLIFLDGLHEWRQTYRDLLHALNHASLQAIVLIDDVVPEDEYSAFPDEHASYRRKDEAGIESRRWHGDVYKVLLALADHHPELEFVITGVHEPGDNPQAIVWRVAPQQAPYETSIAQERTGAYSELVFSDVFHGGERSAVFRVLDEDEASARGEHPGSSRLVRVSWTTSADLDLVANDFVELRPDQAPADAKP